MIYVISRIDFDPMENDAMHARSTTVLGYAAERTAKLYVEEVDARTEKREEWDRQWYPKFTITPIAELDTNGLP